MPRTETIKASDTPPPPKRTAKATSEMLNTIMGLKKDQVLRIQPDWDMSTRGQNGPTRNSVACWCNRSTD